MLYTFYTKYDQDQKCICNIVNCFTSSNWFRDDPMGNKRQFSKNYKI